MNDAIRQRALELGFDGCRFATAAPPQSADQFQQWLSESKHGEMSWLARNANKRVDPQLVLAGAKSIISLTISYARDEEQKRANPPISQLGTLNPEPGTGIIARYARFTDYHDVLGEKLKSLANFVDQLGGEKTHSLWYVDTGPVLERDAAQRAGLGFIGKHTNVISRSLGNWIFLAEILTTLQLAPDAPEKNRCGSCASCITACPTNAITAPFQLDARRCISYLTIEIKGAIPV
ncbi:MAG TPA: tRNA epoxyqueuosine(34) reductase QueG, partial [Verrucomicrobiae bacterium]|nr:tRNA epoxyqueuosine(34) reductase QueG [Verrucomicrobiae bacterium]